MTTETHEETIGAPAEDVWGFIVDPAALSAWFGADAWLEAVPGGTVAFRFFDGSVRRGIVDTVERSRRIVWHWREHRGAGFGSSIGGASVVSIELLPVTEGTRVRITESPSVDHGVTSAGEAQR